jgi:hypothetical protein
MVSVLSQEHAAKVDNVLNFFLNAERHPASNQGEAQMLSFSQKQQILLKYSSAISIIADLWLTFRAQRAFSIYTVRYRKGNSNTLHGVFLGYIITGGMEPINFKEMQLLRFHAVFRTVNILFNSLREPHKSSSSDEKCPEEALSSARSKSRHFMRAHPSLVPASCR